MEVHVHAKVTSVFLIMRIFHTELKCTPSNRQTTTQRCLNVEGDVLATGKSSLKLMSIFFFFGNVHIYTTVVVIPTKLADDMIRWPNIWLHASYVLCSMLLIVGLLGGLIWLRLIVGLRYLLNMCDAYI